MDERSSVVRQPIYRDWLTWPWDISLDSSLTCFDQIYLVTQQNELCFHLIELIVNLCLVCVKSSTKALDAFIEINEHSHDLITSINHIGSPYLGLIYRHRLSGGNARQNLVNLFLFILATEHRQWLELSSLLILMANYLVFQVILRVILRLHNCLFRCLGLSNFLSQLSIFNFD